MGIAFLLQLLIKKKILTKKEAKEIFWKENGGCMTEEEYKEIRKLFGVHRPKTKK